MLYLQNPKNYLLHITYILSLFPIGVKKTTDPSTDPERTALGTTFKLYLKYKTIIGHVKVHELKWNELKV